MPAKARRSLFSCLSPARVHRSERSRRLCRTIAFNFMDYSASRPSLSLTDALVHRARTASKRRLALDVASGVLLAAAAALGRPTGWAVIIGAAVCFATFGMWGLVDRLLDEPSEFSRRPGVVPSLLIVRTISATVGVAAALFILFGIAGIAMGTWIS